MTAWLDRIFWALLAICTAGMLAMQCGCSQRPEAREPTRVEARHCFRLTFRFDGRDQAGLACGETVGLCENARARAMKWGAMMGAKEVGTCRSEK